MQVRRISSGARPIWEIRQLLRGLQVGLSPIPFFKYSHESLSNDLALRLQEEPFVTAYPLGWRYECVWETVTRQDAELLLKVFRAVCCGGDGCCELLQLQLQTILSIMDAIVEKAKYQQHTLHQLQATRLTNPQVMQAHPPVTRAAPPVPDVSYRRRRLRIRLSVAS